MDNQSIKAKIIAPNSKYNGITAGVNFFNGIGYADTDNVHLLEWFEISGYKVEPLENELISKDARIFELEAENTELKSKLKDADEQIEKLLKQLNSSSNDIRKESEVASASSRLLNASLAEEGDKKKEGKKEKEG